LGRRLPGPLPTFIPAAVDPADLPNYDIYGCMASIEIASISL
jgi:hypothetical protein